MRLGISSIAWDVSEDEQVSLRLARLGIDAIDIAPGKYFPDPAAATVDQVAKVRSWWHERGIEITGMQSLLFGTTGLNLFGPAAVRERMLGPLSAVCRIGGLLGATRLVFGSPRNRDRSGLDDEESLTIAVDFFGRLGERAADHGVSVCLEPNPVAYGANFMTTSLEALDVVLATSHDRIRMQLDSGAIALNGEDVASVIERCGPWIGHIHASEPGLVPLGDGGTDHAAVAGCLRRFLPDRLVMIEMVATREEAHLDSVSRAIECARRHYLGPGRIGPTA